MGPQLLPYAVAALGGVFIACQALLNAGFSRLAGSIPAAGAASAFVTCLTLLLVIASSGNPAHTIRGLAAAPFWMPVAGGLLGAGIMVTVFWSLPRIGAGSVIVVLIAGQLMFSALADHFGLFGLQVQRLDLTRIVGLLVVTAGAVLVTMR